MNMTTAIWVDVTGLGDKCPVYWLIDSPVRVIRYGFPFKFDNSFPKAKP